MVLVGIERTDRASDADYLAKKLLNLRLWPDESGAKPWSRSVMQCKYDVLLVSQFTLYAIPKGNKPDFHLAMTPEAASTFYDDFVARVRREYPGGHIAQGVFGADMAVNLTNDGPVTITLDTDQMDFTKENEKEDKVKQRWTNNNKTTKTNQSADATASPTTVNTSDASTSPNAAETASSPAASSPSS